MKMKTTETPETATPAPTTQTQPERRGFRVRTRLRAGGDRLFDSQNNANGFWDEE
jgi:hypothetical protein